MQPLTQNAYPTTRYTDLKAVFELVDTDAHLNATPSTNSDSAISKLSQTINQVRATAQKIGTLETDLFLLDGTFILPDETDNGEIGYISGAISGADKAFLTPPTLTFTFSQLESSIGFTLIFDEKTGNYATDFKIQAFNASDVLIIERTITGNAGINCAVDMQADNYKKLVITFNKTSKAFRRVRLSEIIFGVIQEFNKDNTTELNLLYEISKDGSALPTNELELTFDNVDKLYNMVNPNGVYKFLQQGQKINVKIGIGDSLNNVEFVNMGNFYFTTSKAKDDTMTASITANDLIYTLGQTRCRIGTTGTWTVAAAVVAVLADAGLNIQTSIPAAIQNRTVNKCIPYNTSHREVIRMIAQAARCICYIDRNDVLTFAEITEAATPEDILTHDELFSNALINIAERINKIELTVKDDFAATTMLYTASNKETSETYKIKSFNNPLAYDGQAVADWLLAMQLKRLVYDLHERGNPAREINDTIQIFDVFNVNRNAILTKQEFYFDGALEASSVAIGGFN